MPITFTFDPEPDPSDEVATGSAWAAEQPTRHPSGIDIPAPPGPTVTAAEWLGLEPAAEVLRSQRLAAGLSQVALAAKAGVTQGYITQIETGRRRPTERVVAAYRAAGEGNIGGNG